MIEISSAKEFAVGNLKYIRADVKVDTSAQKLDVLNFNKDPEWASKKVFLKVLAEGKGNLYSLQGDKLLFFYSTDVVAIEQLIYRTFYKLGKAGERTLQYNNFFKQQLTGAVNCKNESTLRIMELEYKTDDLVKYFDSFNVCHGYVIEKKKSTRTSNFFGITLGMEAGRAAFSGANGYHQKYARKYSPRFGVTYEHVFPFNNGTWAFAMEVAYQSYEIKPTISYSSLEIPIGVRYNFFLGEKFKVFGNALLTFDKPIKGEVIDGLRTASTWGNFQVTAAPQLGFGFARGRLSIECRQLFKRTFYLNLSSEYWVTYTKTSFLLGVKINQ